MLTTVFVCVVLVSGPGHCKIKVMLVLTAGWTCFESPRKIHKKLLFQ